MQVKPRWVNNTYCIKHGKHLEEGCTEPESMAESRGGFYAAAMIMMQVISLRQVNKTLSTF